jgi:glycosyltransferase involved in cell wall biosynthesis
MKVLMFGWEFPPFKSGGLGTACYDLTKGLSHRGVQVTFVMPFAPEDSKADFVKIRGTASYSKRLKLSRVSTVLTPYMTAQGYEEALHRMQADVAKQNKGKTVKSHVKVKGVSTGSKEIYGLNLFDEVNRYTAAASIIADEEEHDVIHAHDWMTYRAGINARKRSGKPLVVHIHATEFDRTGGSPNSNISHLEYQGLAAADLVIANSNWTKKNVIDQYKIPESKIAVVHWGIEEDRPEYHMKFRSPINDREKVVLFLGRLTIQKGPDYFVETAKKVLEHEKNVRFMIAGSGDMQNRMIRRVAELGIADKVNFLGFVQGEDVHRAFQMADLYVMPSVSEPFGLVALESLKNNTPILISKQSGASEVITNALKTDFWDVEEMANKIINVIRHPALHYELRRNSYHEARKFNLDEPAKKTEDCYKDVIGRTRL